MYFFDNDFLLSTAVFLLLMLVLARGRRQKRQVAAVEKRLEALAVDMEALYAGTSGIDRTMTDINRKIERITEQQEKTVVRDNFFGGYNNAIRMIKHGATIDDLVGKCGIGRSEAQLLHAIHAARRESHPVLE